MSDTEHAALVELYEDARRELRTAAATLSQTSRELQRVSDELVRVDARRVRCETALRRVVRADKANEDGASTETAAQLVDALDEAATIIDEPW